MTNYDQIILNKWGHLPFFRKAGSEWKGGCPRCLTYGHVPGSGKPDRFYVNEPDHILPFVRGKCRKCGFFDPILETRIDGTASDMTPQEKAAAEREVREMEEEAQRRRQAILDKIRREEYFRAFHDTMTEEQRKVWLSRGISYELQDWFVLGYNPNKSYKWNGERKHNPALTIPYLREDHRPVNMAYRILNDRMVRYRYEFGLPAAIFLFDTDAKEREHVLVVEGAIKAIICGAHLGHNFSNVVGLPSCNLNQEMADDLSNYKRVTFLLDPDTHEPDKNGRVAVKEAANLFGSRAWVATPPGNMKPDDFLLHYSGNTIGKGTDYMMAAIDSAVQNKE